MNWDIEITSNDSFVLSINNHLLIMLHKKGPILVKLKDLINGETRAETIISLWI